MTRDLDTTTATDELCQNLINSQRYDLADSDSNKRTSVIADCRCALSKDGCAVLPQFLSSTGIRTLFNEALQRRDQTYFSKETQANIYFSADDPDLPETHPRRVFFERTNGFITSDLFEPTSAAYQLYHWPPLARFLADCLEKDSLYLYDDPISNMIVNVGIPNSEFTWHFDTNEFTITLLLQPAESGGQFEYVPNLRSATDECYDEVSKVLDGHRQRVVQLNLKPGDMQLFLGRFSLHRVTKNTGTNDRLLLIMSFAERPGMIGSTHRVRSLYGKVTAAHIQAEGQRVRNDSLAD